jgi:hypothetical protein
LKAANERLEGETWLLRRLLRHKVDALAGDVTELERKARFRAAIRDNGLDLVVAGSTKEHKPINYAAAFERLYGEKL